MNQLSTRFGALAACIACLLLTTCGGEDTGAAATDATSAAAVQAASQKPEEVGTGRGHPPLPTQPAVPPQRTWKPITADGIHDPTNPAAALLQQPEEALSVLPEALEGNQVDWAAALRSGAITPRTNIFPETNVNILDLDILFEDTAGMPLVLFPHRPHTEWLDCSNCHDKIFRKQKGANQIGMLDVLQGNYCGQCHGAVSFPLTQCFRCHSVDRASATTVPGQ